MPQRKSSSCRVISAGQPVQGARAFRVSCFGPRPKSSNLRSESGIRNMTPNHPALEIALPNSWKPRVWQLFVSTTTLQAHRSLGTARHQNFEPHGVARPKDDPYPPKASDVLGFRASSFGGFRGTVRLYVHVPSGCSSCVVDAQRELSHLPLQPVDAVKYTMPKHFRVYGHANNNR